MTDPVTLDVQLPEDKPPAWVNSLMSWMLTTAGIQAMVGKGVALLSLHRAQDRQDLHDPRQLPPWKTTPSP